MKRICIICGAQVKNLNKKTNTCDPICTRAKHSNRTREKQIKHEMRVDEYNDCMAGHAKIWIEEQPGGFRKDRLI